MKISVVKFDPSRDPEPYTITGEVPFREKMTALEALLEFSNTVEHVNFDYSCACRLCGRCTMMLDDVPVFACVVPLTDSDHTFAPLKGFPVIRDLVVDKDSLDNQLSRLYDRVRIEPFNEETVIPTNYDSATKDPLYHIEFCCRCGVCNVTCPSKALYPEEYVGPAAQLATAYRFLDPLDTGDRVMEAVNNGLYRCILCGRCDEVCVQQDIKHVEAWQMLRKAAAERGIVPSYAV
jgi:succinate dehydrogenase/fumarate reductase iron-sulfur protein